VSLAVSVGNRSSHTDDDSPLHVTYYFRHVSVVKNNDTVYVVVIRVVDGLANHSRTLSSDSGNVCGMVYPLYAFCIEWLRLVDQERMRLAGAFSLAGVHASSLLECLDTVSGMTGRHLAHKKPFPLLAGDAASSFFVGLQLRGFKKF